MDFCDRYERRCRRFCRDVCDRDDLDRFGRFNCNPYIFCNRDFDQQGCWCKDYDPEISRFLSSGEDE
ncbi:hypothetical protein ROZALSC1DRAFT_30505 [Rozella allomycis CSF55]|uniref:Uncharacterized protein n=1 Tax=Rozella allomycis (strain CSF55) TaxID=988480 RepID=A0A075B564_ROZAC|nr:hypothetical protein O9G_004580 [Rozella allomycis CSF55]RKP17721.1 hypothetical protein ROZALSC1DRAFT_30505 [Rozella allomycis CSF55]|eukprot:EPZ36788.1 hypothetical protein O9G_004580 [Rozella allomycis CSF55]